MTNKKFSEDDIVDVLFCVSIFQTLLGLGVILSKDPFAFGGLMMGVGVFSMLLILAIKIFVTIVDSLGRGFC